MSMTFTGEVFLSLGCLPALEHLCATRCEVVSFGLKISTEQLHHFFPCIRTCSVTMLKVLDASGPPGHPALLSSSGSAGSISGISAVAFSNDGEV